MGKSGNPLVSGTREREFESRHADQLRPSASLQTDGGIAQVVEQETFNFEVQGSSPCAPTKVCGRCGVTKSVLEFHKNKHKKDGLQSRCKTCCSVVNADTYIRLPNRKPAIKKRNEHCKLKDLALIRRYKRLCGCRFCGEKEPCALDLHHLDGEQKDLSVSRLYGGSRSRLKAEVRKCVVLCANCHRKHHAGVPGYLDIPGVGTVFIGE